MEDGILLDKDVIETYEQLKTSETYRYLIFTITEDKKMIEIEQKGEQEETYWDTLNHYLRTKQDIACLIIITCFKVENKLGSKSISIGVPEGIKVANEIAFSSNNKFF